MDKIFVALLFLMFLMVASVLFGVVSAMIFGWPEWEDGVEYRRSFWTGERREIRRIYTTPPDTPVLQLKEAGTAALQEYIYSAGSEVIDAN